MPSIFLAAKTLILTIVARSKFSKKGRTLETTVPALPFQFR